MAGSQLKKLKATLKEHGLTGQANIKKNLKNTKRKARDYDREEKTKVISKIREQFNPFEVKTTKNKRNIETKSNASKDRVAVGKPGISKQAGEQQRLQAYEARKLLKNRRGGVVDRRFGERDRNLTEEEKMLERFTRERQSQSKNKKNLYNLEDDDNVYGDDDGNDNFGMTLTHGGVALDGDEEFDDAGNGISGKRGALYDDAEDGNVLGGSQPARKKTKAEVMKEVIAKSKFHKQERQKTQALLEDKIDDLDEDFDDVMSALMSTQTKPKSMQPKSDVDINYDTKFRELNADQRAVPADRTKTEEELKKEADEKKQKLEQQRLDRMKGMVEDEEGEERGVEDLDDGFWSGNDEEDEEERMADSDDDIKFDQNDDDAHSDSERRPFAKIAVIPCPSNHEELLTILEKYSLKDHPKVVRKIIKTYQPKLAEGNKEKLGKLTAIVLRHIMFISNQDYQVFIEDFELVINGFISIVKTLSEKYNKDLSEECRHIITEIQDRFRKHHYAGLHLGDVVFFIIVGTIFSTSDLYHLVATPCILLMCEILEQLKYNTSQKIALGALLTQICLRYQRLSKRYIPEMLYFFEKSLATLGDVSTEATNLSLPRKIEFTSDDTAVLKLHQLFGKTDSTSDSFKKTLTLNILASLEIAISNTWKDLSAFPEISSPIETILLEFTVEFPSLSKAKEVHDKISRLSKFIEHTPLSLQNHKPMAIPSHAPKFEENFNPDKKSYDPDVTRNEINKMKAQIKKERKFTMKELRKDTRFEARQRIDEKKKEASEYHAKMAHIYNTISTEEGAEKNKYEREKKLRSNKK